MALAVVNNQVVSNQRVYINVTMLAESLDPKPNANTKLLFALKEERKKAAFTS